jgi:hypothetical protein
MEGRLAVECDGDTWHGVERFQEDMARQRMLERSGWTFWRVRGGTFYRDPDAALEKLWSTLDQLRIYPTSQEGGLGNSTNAEQTGFHGTGPSAEEFQDISSAGTGGTEEKISPNHLRTKKNNNFGFDLKETKTLPISEDKKISLDGLIPLIVKVLRKHGGRAQKEQVEKEIYERFQDLFKEPWYQEIVSTGVQRWRYLITLAKEVAKSRGLIKRPEDYKRGYWELSEKAKR